jgi:hypothetical protein
MAWCYLHGIEASSDQPRISQQQQSYHLDIHQRFNSILPYLKKLMNSLVLLPKCWQMDKF